MNLYLAITLLLAGVAIGALSTLMLRASIHFLKRSYRQATQPGNIAGRTAHLVGKALISDGIAIGFISSIAAFAGMNSGWCYFSACMFGSWTTGIASVCIGIYSVVLYFWGPRFSGGIQRSK